MVKNNKSRNTEQATMSGSKNNTTLTETVVQELAKESTKEPVQESTKEPVQESTKEHRLNGSFPEDLLSQFRFTSSFEEFQRKLDFQLNELKSLRAESRRLLSAYEYDLQRVQKSKRRRRANVEPSGFIKKTLLPSNLAVLLGVEHGTPLSTPEITKRFYAVIEERKLYDEKDHRIFRPDAQTRQVFGLPDSVLTSTSHKDKNGFNFMTLQKHLSQCLKQVNNSETKQPEQPKQVEQPKQSKQSKKVNKTAVASA